jgi:hypothetical protein
MPSFMAEMEVNSMAALSPHGVKRVIGAIFPCLTKPQQKSLSIFVTGLCKARSGIMAESARKITGATSLRDRVKRIYRFVANKRFKPHALFRLWISWAIKSFIKKKQITIAIDWTELPGRIRVLMAGIPFAGRAIPLYWILIRNADITDSQTLVEERFVTKLKALLPPDFTPVLVFDRGFRGATFIQFLKDLQVLFVVRVTADVYVTAKKGRTVKLRDYTLKPNIPQVFKNAAYREDGLVKGITVIGITIAQNKDDPWWLVTNLSKTEHAIRVYERRFDIEEWFRDLKHELDIDTIYTKRIKRVRVILLTACISYGLLLLLGRLAKKYPAWIKRVVTNSCYSLIFLALRLIEERIPNRSFFSRWVRSATVPGG